jgi:hypothetical protein
MKPTIANHRNDRDRAGRDLRMTAAADVEGDAVRIDRAANGADMIGVDVHTTQHDTKLAERVGRPDAAALTCKHLARTTAGMLHNSLFRRELLQSMNRHPLIVARRDVHRNVGVRPGVKAAAATQVMLGSGAWAVRAARKSAAEAAVAADATDFPAKTRRGRARGCEERSALRNRIDAARVSHRCIRYATGNSRAPTRTRCGRGGFTWKTT